jgi:hypothetical protein
MAVQSTSPHPTSPRSILILPTHLRLGLPSGLFPSGFHTNNLYAFIFCLIRVTWSAHFILLNLIILIILVEDFEEWLILWSTRQSSWLQNGDELCWGMNCIYICYVKESRPPLQSSGQSSWLQNQRSDFDYRCYQIFWEVVGLERSPLSPMSTIEELLERKGSGSGLESEHTAVEIRHADHATISIRKSWH